MRVCVVIATYGRKSILPTLLEQLDQQDRPPDEVIISAPDADHIDRLSARNFKLTYVFGRTGLCAQRNRALDEVIERSDVITFFDDDFIPATNYISNVEDLFAKHEDWAVVTGNVVLDGARSAGITFDEALEALKGVAREPKAQTTREREGAYGCNMSFRSSMIGDLRFDEKLSMYGWLEDIDFSSQMSRQGKVVWVSDLYGVHLGAKGGRSSGVRLGYSQVINPIYLIRKGTLSRRFGLRLIRQNVAANIVRSIRPEPYVDRRGRLRGNFLAAGHLLSRRIDPTYILKL